MTDPAVPLLLGALLAALNAEPLGTRSLSRS